MSEHSVIDPQIFRFAFFLRKHAREKSKEETEHWEQFVEAVKGSDGVLRWAKVDPQKAQFSDHWRMERNVTQRWVSSDYTEASDGILRQVDVRNLLDSYYIFTGCARQDSHPPGKFAELMRASWSPPTDLHAFLDEGICLTAELPAEITPEEVRCLIAESMKAVGQDPDLSHIIEAEFGWIYVPTSPEQKAWGVFALDGAEEMKLRDDFCYRVFPSVLLAWLKSWQIIKDYETKLLKQTETTESELNEELKEYAKKPCRLNSLEGSSDRIANHQIELAEQLSIIEEQQVTLQANVENLDRLQERSLPKFLPDASLADWQTILIDPLRMQAEQMKTDLAYFYITRDQADRTLNGIGTLTGILSAKWERWITILFGLFAGTGVAQLFPETYSLEFKLGVAGGIAFVIFLIVKGVDLWSWVRWLLGGNRGGK